MLIVGFSDFPLESLKIQKFGKFKFQKFGKFKFQKFKKKKKKKPKLLSC